jgi:hypothetical protein
VRAIGVRKGEPGPGAGKGSGYATTLGAVRPAAEAWPWLSDTVTMVWLSAAGAAILAIGYALNPHTGQVFVGGRNPYAAPGLPTDTLFAVGLTLGAVALVAALVAAVNRLRRSSGVERQQMKWFALASGFAVVALPVAAALWAVTPLVHPMPAIALTLWPIAIGVAILRYRLYDIDLLITRTVVYGHLTALFTAVYLVIVVGVGTLIGSRESGPVPANRRHAVIAVAFQPARERSHRYLPHPLGTEFCPTLRRDHPRRVTQRLVHSPPGGGTPRRWGVVRPFAERVPVVSARSQ